MNFTIIGGQGFVGSEVVNQLTIDSHTVWVPEKSDDTVYEKHLGTVIYCAGHGDCTNNPMKVLQSNTTDLSLLLQKAKFDKLVYISSTRVYMNQHQSDETCDLSIINEDDRKLFNLTKLVSEELCFKSKRNCIVVRPSNVYGVALDSPLFLPSITRSAILNGKVDMYVPENYSKDYVAVSDVAKVIIHISKLKTNNEKVINIASGYNVTAKDIADILAKQTNCEIIWHESSSNERFPETQINTMKSILNINPRSVKEDLVNMINAYKEHLSQAN